MLDDLIDAVARYCADEERSKRLQQVLMEPLLAHLAARYTWLFRAVQALAILIFLQFIVVLWILLRTFKRT